MEPETVTENVVRRKLAEESPNLAAAPSPRDGTGPPKIIALPTRRSSGSFPAVPKDKKEHPISILPPPVAVNQETPQTSTSPQPPANQPPESNLNKWKIWVILSCILLLIIIAMALWCVCRSRAAKTIAPWRTGISGQLQKAFVTGNSSFPWELFFLSPIYTLKHSC